MTTAKQQWTPATFVHLPSGRTAYQRRLLERYDYAELIADAAATDIYDNASEVRYTQHLIDASIGGYTIFGGDDDEYPDTEVPLYECGWIDAHGLTQEQFEADHGERCITAAAAVYNEMESK
ncbi:hypothetical protein [Rhodobacter capsulatus]|uniref:hypothetical protein n=1 Tax=Rhodobacter capsulatus TaxID=1061 RepID=UPI004025FD1C